MKYLVHNFLLHTQSGLITTDGQEVPGQGWNGGNLLEGTLVVGREWVWVILGEFGKSRHGGSNTGSTFHSKFGV